MRRSVAVVLGLVLMFAALLPAAALGAQPGRGESSTGRNDAGFGGGPHCHVLTVRGDATPHGYIRVFPSHTAHESTGLPARIFAADGDCDGQPGVAG
jgi:hypothetical protein